MDVVHITFTADYEIKMHLSMISYCPLENRYSTEKKIITRNFLVLIINKFI